ncbi:MAG: C25 family cysteine peptidase, partial [Verrucomicrobiota bacterium]|nr:C25 family cysteine peptidase [Verrucomicrobiota bacterium]
MALLIFLNTFSISGVEFPRRHAVELSVTTQESPPQIRLHWFNDGEGTSYRIIRRRFGDSSWSERATLGGNSNSWTDQGVETGVRYEYHIQKQTSLNYTAHGYVLAGINAPVLENFNKIILVVENSIAAAAGNEISRLERDLSLEGWTVIKKQFSASDSPVSIRNAIRAEYQNDPTRVRALFLLGHIPVPYSGDIMPDGHENHRGAWPADLYYGEMDGNWTDRTVNTTSAERQINWNVPGDGKFDQSVI